MCFQSAGGKALQLPAGEGVVVESDPSSDGGALETDV